MPFPSFRRKDKYASSTPEVSSQSRPLVYAQSTYAPSEVDSHYAAPPPEVTKIDFPPEEPGTLSISGKTMIRPKTHKAMWGDEFADITYLKEVKVKKAAAAKAKAEAEGIEPEPKPGDEFDRTRTPPQGSRSLPWESYRDLPRDHPVFRYPPEVREKMYAKRIDPVVMAINDDGLRGKVYGEKTNPWKSFVKRGTHMGNQLGGMYTGGGYY